MLPNGDTRAVLLVPAATDEVDPECTTAITPSASATSASVAQSTLTANEMMMLFELDWANGITFPPSESRVIKRSAFREVSCGDRYTRRSPFGLFFDIGEVSKFNFAGPELPTY